MQLELLVCERLPQGDLELAAALRFLLHGGFVEPAAVPSGLLCAIQGEVGMMQEVVRLAHGRGDHGNTDAASDAHVKPLDRNGTGNLLDQPFGDGGGIVRRYAVREQHGKFVAAQACGDVAFAEVVPDTVGHHLKEGVTRLVAERVVHRLETVQVEIQECAFLDGPRQSSSKKVLKCEAIVEAGERVMMRQVGHSGGALPLLSDIVEGSDPTADGQ